MNRSFVLTRRSLLACAAAAPLAMTLGRAHAAGDIGPKTYERARRELIDAIARSLALGADPKSAQLAAR